MTEVERRSAQNDKDSRYVLVKLEKHEQILDGHTETLDQHTRILDAHTKTLDQHTRILDAHTEQFRLIREELDEHKRILDEHTDQFRVVGEGLAWLRRASAKTMDFFGIESPEEE